MSKKFGKCNSPVWWILSKAVKNTIAKKEAFYSKHSPKFFSTKYYVCYFSDPQFHRIGKWDTEMLFAHCDTGFNNTAKTKTEISRYSEMSTYPQSPAISPKHRITYLLWTSTFPYVCLSVIQLGDLIKVHTQWFLSIKVLKEKKLKFFCYPDHPYSSPFPVSTATMRCFCYHHWMKIK